MAGSPQHYSPFALVTLVTAALMVQVLGHEPALAAARPHIVLILADDLGYGDVQPLNPTSKIATPNINRLAAEGMTLTDAHTPSAVCTPTRYGLLCGRYCWRTRLKRGVLGGYSPTLIEPGRQTVASLLKKAGYHTACIGKWHLGIDWAWQQGTPDAQSNSLMHVANRGAIDYSRPILGGPTSVGFDTSYVIPASLDMSPNVYVHDQRVVAAPNRIIPQSPFPAYYRRAEISPDFHHVDVLDHLLEKAITYIQERAGGEQPFFLYFPLTAPHKPVLPHPRFEGKSGLGPYGDFVIQVDWTVGEVLRALDEVGVADETLLIMTSDNGSFMYRYRQVRQDHVDDPAMQGYRPEHHRANGPLRGTKADIWEAGHRVPFLVRWPGRVAAGARSDTTICLTDVAATLAELVGVDFDRRAAEDSFSFLSVLQGGTSASTRPAVIHHSVGGMFAVRQGPWKLVLGNGSGGRERPAGKPFEQPFQLFHLAEDLGEATNVAAAQSATVGQLQQSFAAIAHGDHEKRVASKEASP